MAINTESADLKARLLAGDRAAQTEVVTRYMSRLLALVEGRLTQPLKRKMSAGDIVQSAFKDFFPFVLGGHIRPESPDGLWPLLVLFTVRKHAEKVRKQNALKRAGEVEMLRADGDSAEQFAVMAQGPTPAEEATANELIGWLLEGARDGSERRAIQLWLLGLTQQEVAGDKDVGVTERTVRRWLERTRKRLLLRYPEFSQAKDSEINTQDPT